MSADDLFEAALHKALRRVYLLDDTGSGQPYTHSAATNLQFDYFKRSYRYWLDGCPPSSTSPAPQCC